MKWYIQNYNNKQKHDQHVDSLLSTIDEQAIISRLISGTNKNHHHESLINKKIRKNHYNHHNRKEKRFFTSLCIVTFILILLILILSNNFNVILHHHKFIWHNRRCNENNETEMIHKESQKVLPHCIIVGVRKCGTRALLEFLDIHPLITKVVNEIHFFDDEKRFNLGLEWYRQQMPITNQSNIVIEKTPAYFVTESVPERIYAMNASIKIILIVRDPVTRLISDYAQLASNKAKKVRHVETFEEAVLYPNGKVNSSYKGIRISMYAVYFSRWIKV